MDVLSASYVDDKFAWYENTDGHGSFGPQRVITESATWATSVFGGDLDGDGDIDVISASWQGVHIAWYENTNGQGSFGLQQEIATSARGVRSVFSADIDGDGDLDILSASEYDDEIAWYRNEFLEALPNLEHSLLPAKSRLTTNYPNPFNPETTISFELIRREQVQLRVYNLTGQVVNKLLDSLFPQGKHSIQFDGSNLCSGLYIVQLRTDSATDQRKILLIK